MDIVNSLFMLVMSFVPWWMYAIFAVAIYFVLRSKLGEKIALAYAIAATIFVSLDAGGDIRERWVKADWKAQAERAQALARKVDEEAAADTGADLQAALDKERALRREMQNALESAASADGCGDVDAALERLRPR